MIKLAEGGIADLWRDEKSPEMQAVSYALQQAVKMISEKVEKTKCFSDIDKLNEDTLDYLAVEQRAMYYSQTLSAERKRAIIKNTLNWYTKAGTPAAVSEMVDVVLGDGKVVEWFDFDEPPYTPGTFDIVTTALMTADIMEQLIGLIQKVKNVRSHVRRVIVKREIDSGMNVCSWMYSTQDSIVTNVLLGNHDVDNRIYAVGYLSDAQGETTVMDDIHEESEAAAGQTIGGGIFDVESTTMTIDHIYEESEVAAGQTIGGGISDVESTTMAIDHIYEESEAAAGQTIGGGISDIESTTTAIDQLRTDSEAQQSEAVVALHGEVKETSTTVK